MEQNIERLEEIINDNDQIVTVPSFGMIQNISLEESKKSIEKYVELNKDSKNLYVTFILYGVKKDTHNYSILQIDHKKLDDEKQFYTNPIVNIYSIQKTKNIDKNIISLSNPNVDVNKYPLLEAIIGCNCVKRVLHKNVLPPLPTATIRGKSAIFTNQNSKSGVKSNNIKSSEKDGCNEESNKAKANMQGSISNMFKNTPAKNVDTKQSKIEPKHKVQNAGLSNFLIKKENSSEPKPKEIKNKETEIENIESNSNQDEISTQDIDIDDAIMKDLSMHEEKPTIIKEDKRPEIVKTSRTKTGNQKRKREKVGSNDRSQKRKRIVVMDSDSDDMFESEKSDNEEIANDKSNEEPHTELETKPPLPKNKKRKAVKKTYEDEDGFIVTQTEYILETASEDENEPDNKVPKKEIQPQPKLEKKNSNSDIEISPNKTVKNKKSTKKAPAGNQPTLMSFFKKK